MFSHITVGSCNLTRSEKFYNAVLVPLGLMQRPVDPDGGPASLCWIAPNTKLPRFYVYEPFNRQPASAGNGGMVAFMAPTPAAVDKAHAAGVTVGGSCDGPPAERPHYGAGYYGAYLRDPDGNKIHIVHRGDISG